MFSELSFEEGFSKVDAELDVIFVPSDELVVEAMLKMAAVTEKDIVYDLGCGDGRIPVAAAMGYSAHAVGIDMDPRRITEANELARTVSVEHRVKFIQDDLLSVDFSEATVVTLYLLPSLNVKLKKRILTELEPGTRIIAHAFNMGQWQPDAKRAFGDVYLYKWYVPAQIQGTWEWLTAQGQLYRVELQQEFQMLNGRAWIDEQPAQLVEAKMQGARVHLTIASDGKEGDLFVSVYQEGKLLPAVGSKQISPAVQVMD
ncbi:class I SAM-dependent methyltransferase [Denitrificimonas sp. JX-1]|uniref:Class I SAM-dependent methyltransferase n=1 Tax=Denitrificimonas halotolerans TaxID=3098930 RepID=A0ABU5GRT5_9GAMM|nr:class I SAM-dependent methyltransferase [Denitrificimonas sp. JX-1]